MSPDYSEAAAGMEGCYVNVWGNLCFSRAEHLTHSLEVQPPSTLRGVRSGKWIPFKPDDWWYLCPGTLEVEECRSGVQDHPWLHSEFKANLGYLRPWHLKKKELTLWVVGFRIKLDTTSHTAGSSCDALCRTLGSGKQSGVLRCSGEWFPKLSIMELWFYWLLSVLT